MINNEFKRIGLTGGIGSGKSTLARFFAEAGVDVIDADAISRQLTAAGGAAMPAIRASFGADFIADDGSMNRDRMRERVFSDKQARMQLQALLHPMITGAIQDQQARIRLKNSFFVIIEIPLLIESNYWRSHIDRVLVVDCDESTQIRRVVQRSQLQADQVSRILAQQANRLQRLAAADWVVNNETDNLDLLKTRAFEIQLHF
jgi:dephospho-CoA kinase